MSTTIENKVVEMSFNNSDFEKNAQQTIDTTEKLKKSLDFDGAGKGLEQLGSAAKNCNIGVLATAAENVSEKFDYMKYIGLLALQDIYNMATRTAAQIVNMFAIQPVSDGFAEYELKMGSIQTIMASTSASLEEVNGYLDELNVYADKTIYSFADMTNNIGKFTNAGVDLKTAVAAIQGISNEAAVSGANTNEASRAMYNFAQALSAGYVKLIDWKSIENANMATVEFKQQLIDTAVELGNLEKQADGTYKVLTQSSTGSTMDEAISATKNFNDSLQYQWMTTNVLTKTLARYSDETTEIGKKAFASATEVKTFSMMMDTLTESAGSGWTDTWETVIGDFESAKKFWTKLTDYFDDIIGNISDARINLLKATLASGFDLIEDKFENTFEDAGLTTENLENKIIELGKNSGLAMDDIIAEAGSLGQAFEDGKISTDLITQAIDALGAGTDVSADKITSLKNSATDMFDNFRAKSGRTLMQESLYNTLDSIKMIIETINNTWTKLDDTFTSSKIYDVLQKINGATTDFKNYISENLADPWNDVEQAITDSGMTMDEFQSKLADTASANGIDLNSLIEQYGSLQSCFEEGAITGDLVIKMFDEMNSSTTTTTKTVTKTIDNLSEVLSKYQTVVDQVWNGDWKNAPERYQLLADAGWDYQKVQALVNRTVDQHRITLEDLNAVGIETTETTEEQVEVLNELATEATKSGTSINEALNKLGHKTGLQLSVEAVHDLFVSLKTVVKSFKDAVVEAFDSSIISTFSSNAYSAITWIQSKTEKFSNYITSRSNELKNTFKGPLKMVQSIGKDITSVITGLIKVLGKLFGNVDSALPDVLSMTSSVGEFFSTLADAIDVSSEIETFFNNLVTIVPDVVDVFNDLIEALQGIPIIGDIIANGENLWDWISGGIGDQVNKIESGEIDLHAAIVHVGEVIVNGISEAASYVSKNGFVGIQKGLAEGKITVTNGLSDIASGMSGPIATISDKTKEFLAKLGKAALSITPIIGAFLVLNKVSTTIGNYAKMISKALTPFNEFRDMLDSFTGFAKQCTTSVKDLSKSLTKAIQTEALINIAVAIGIIAGVVVVLVKVMQDDPETAVQALWIVGAIAVGLGYLAIQLGQVNLGDTKQLGEMGVFLLAVAAVFVVIAYAVKQFASLSIGELANGIGAAAVILILIGVLVYEMSKAVNKSEHSMSKNAAKAYKAIGTAILEIGAAFLIIAIGVKIIAGVSDSGWAKAISIMTIFYGFITAIIAIFAFVAKDAATVASMSKLISTLGNSMLEIGAGFALVAVGIAIIGSLSNAQLNKAVKTLYSLIGFLAVMFIAAGVAQNIAGSGEVAKLSANLLAVSVAIGIMAGIGVLLGYCDPSVLDQGIEYLGGFEILALVMYSCVAAINKYFGGSSSAKFAAQLLAISSSIAIMAAIAVLLGYCDPDKTEQGIEFVEKLGAVASVMALAASKISQTVVGNMTAMAACVAVLAVAAVALSLIEPSQLEPAVNSLVSMILAFSTMCAAVSLIEDVKGVTTKIVLLTAVVASFAAIITLMCSFGTNMDLALSVAAALSLLMVSMAAAMLIISNCKSDVALSKVVLGETAGVAVVAAALLAALCYLIGNKAAASVPIAAALSKVMLAMAEAMWVISQCKADAKLSLSMLGGMAEVAALSGALLWVLCSTIGDKAAQAMPIAEALAVIMPVLAACGAGLSKFGGSPIATSTIVSLGVLTACMAVIGAVIAEMVKSIGNRATQAYPIAIALGGLIIVLTACAAALSQFGIKPINTSVIVTLVALAAIMAVLGVVITNMVNAISNNADAAIQAAASLSIILIAIAGAAAILQTIQAFNIVAAGQACGVAIVVLAAVVAGVIALATVIEQNGGKVQTAMTNFVTIMTAIGEGIGGFVGGLIGNLIKSLLTPLVTLVDGMGDAFTKLASALSILTAADVAKAMILVEVFSTLAGANFPSLLINQLIEAFSGESPIEAGLRSLGEGIAAFANAVAGVDTAAITAIAPVVGTLTQSLKTALEATGGSPLDQIVTALIGNASIAEGMQYLGEGMKAFANATAGIDVTGLGEKATATKYLAEALSALNGVTIPDMLTSDDGTFNTAIDTMGSSLQTFNGYAAAIDSGAIQNGTQALKDLITALSEIPSEGGWLSAILGGQDYTGFASSITAIGGAIASFSGSIQSDSFDSGKVTEGANAIKTIIESLADLPNTGGWLQTVMGGQDYSGFGNSLEDLGEGIKKFVKAADGTTTDTVKPAADAIKYVCETLKEMPSSGGLLGILKGSDTMDMSEFQSQLRLLGMALKNFADSTADCDFTKASKAVSVMGDICTRLSYIKNAGVTSGDAETVKTIIGKLKDTDVSGLSETFSEENVNSIHIDTLFTKIKDAITNGAEAANFDTAMQTVTSKIFTSLSQSIANGSSNMSAGTNIATALSTSITNAIPTVNNAATQMGTAFRTSFDSCLTMLEANTSVAITNVISVLNSHSAAFQSLGTTMMNSFYTGLSMGAANAASAITSTVTSIVSTANLSAASMQSAGSMMMTYMSNGIIAASALPRASAAVVANLATAGAISMLSVFIAAGRVLGAGIATGISAMSGTVRAAAQSVANSAASALSNTSVYRTYGSYAAQGFANGLSDSSYRVVLAAQAMAKAAAEAAKKALDIRSPSHVFMGIGDFVGQGLAIGMDDTRKLVEDSAAKLGTASVDGFNSASGGLLDMNSSIVPTIDYSSIKANTGKLDFSATISRLVSNPVKSSAELMAETQAKFDASNQRLADGLTALQSDLATYSDAIANSETAMYVDGKKLASSIVKPMNQQLGILAKRNA